MLQTIIRRSSPIVRNLLIQNLQFKSRDLLSNYIRSLYTLYRNIEIIYHHRNENHRQMHSNMETLDSGTDGDNTIENSNSCMDKVFVQNYPEKDSLTISFNLTFEGKSKQFNMIRKSSDPLTSVIERIRLNFSKLTKTKKGKKRDVESEPNICKNIELIMDGSPVKLDIKNIDAWVDGAILKLDDKLYEITTNNPQVESMKLPSCIMKGFLIVPSVNLINCSVSGCKFEWYRQLTSQEKEKYLEDGICSKESLYFDNRYYWYKIEEGLIFCPKEEDVAHNIKIICKPSDGTKNGPEFSTISPAPVELGPSNCPFEKRHTLTYDKIKESNKFRFVTYNILANLYADSDYSRTVLFSHCPAYALEIDYRRQLLLKEMLGYNGDIYCLQEVDKKEFERTFKPFFEIVGNYSGIFDTKGGSVAEGEATFFNNDKFDMVDTHKTLLSELIEEKITLSSNVESEEILKEQTNDATINIEERKHLGEKVLVEAYKSTHFILKNRNSSEAIKCLNKFNDIRQAILAKAALKRRFCDRHTIIQTTLLKFKESKNDYLLVANTHLYFAPDADHVRLLQGSVCVKYLEYLKNYYKEFLINQVKNPNINIILTGDMNSTPECGLYKLLTKGNVESNLADWSSAGDEESVSELNLSTNLRFSSAYENIEYTNYTPGFNGCLDYIYYERDNMICESTIPLPDHKDVVANGGIPSEVFPSDHLALIANIKTTFY